MKDLWLAVLCLALVGLTAGQYTSSWDCEKLTPHWPSLKDKEPWSTPSPFHLNVQKNVVRPGETISGEVNG